MGLGALALRFGLLLLLIALGLRVLLPLVEGGLGLLLQAVALRVRLGPDFRLQLLLFHLDLVLLQLRLALGLGDFRVDRGGFDALALLLALDFIGGVRLGLFAVRQDFQLRPLDVQLRLLLGDLGVRQNPGLVGLPFRLRLGDGDVPVRLGLGDGGVFLDEARIVRAQVFDEPVFVGDVLDVAGEDFDAQLVHVLAGFLHDLVGEGIPVRIDFLQGQRADDLPHIALEGVLEVPGDLLRALVQKVLGRQLDALRVGGDADLCHGVHIDVDKVAGGDGLLGFDVHRHLPQVQPVHALEEGNPDSGPADEDLALLFQAGDDVRLIGRGLDVAGQDDGQHHYHGQDDGKQGQDVVKHLELLLSK